ncbi:MAG: heme exporter protein CcmB [SAR324 cluster bacterium]|nr:heme exporter protein CcmB [SAR324 cluster bacterium]
MPLAIRQIWALLRKDLLIDLRRKENLLSMFFFALLTLMTFYLAAGSMQETRFRLTPRALALLSVGRWPPERIDALRPLLGRSFETQAGFLAELKAVEDLELSGEERIELLGVARGTAMQELAPGFLWVTFLLAGVLGLDKSFGQERENGCLEGLLLTPVGRGLIYLGKMGGNAAFLIGILVLLVPLYSLLFQLTLWDVLPALALISLGGVVGFTALGTLLGGLVSTLRGKEVLLPLLLFPLVAPLLIALVQLTGAVLAGDPLSLYAHWIRLVLGFDVLFLVVSFLAFEYVVES